MPELPEVETVRRGLLPLIGSKIIRAEVLRDRSVRNHEGGPAAFSADIQGLAIQAAVRRGKFLWLPLDDAAALLVHLGMSGQLRVWHDEPARHPHLRVRFELQAADGTALGLDFIDQRTFGHLAIVDLVPTLEGKPGGAGSIQAVIPKPAAHIARDVLDPNLDTKQVIARIKTKNTEIKRVLLDQTVLSGIGNIYADEALWKVQIHPQAKAAALSANQISALITASQQIIARSLVAGGTSFDALYVNVNGESGSNSENLVVYGQAGHPCPNCGTAIERITFMNRSSHLCPTCQRLRKSRR